MLTFAKKLVVRMIAPYSRLRLRQAMDCTDVDTLVKRIFSWSNREFRPAQSAWELKEFLLRVQHLQPKRVMEIGTFHGGVFFLLTRVSSQEGTFISVDLPGGAGGDDMLDKNIPLLRQWAAPSQNLHFLREDSHRPETLEMVKRILGESQLDVLFIDGDHSYEGVKKDYEMYAPLVRSGGLVGFHDISVKEPQYGVAQYWGELRAHHRHEELIGGSGGSAFEFPGYGLLWTP